MAVERDYYEVLGVPRDAAVDTIKDAYHRLAMKWHPDRNKSPQAEERFKEIAKAYAVLHDPKKRARYDARGHEGVAHFSHDDLFRGVDLGSIFGDLGVGFGPGGDSIFERLFGGGRGPLGGQDLRVRLDVSIERIATGGVESVHLSRPVACEPCKGHGTRSGKPPARCAACGGSGQRVVSQQTQHEGERTVHVQRVAVCDVCSGRGAVTEEPCPVCGGQGRVEKAETLKVKVPAGMDEGMTLRVPGHGLPAVAGGVPGDLLVTVFTTPDQRFQRRGADLWRSETVDVAEAVLGTRRSVPTLDGEAVVTVPPGTQPDTVLRLRGKGLPQMNGSDKGDLNVRIQVHVPEPKELGDEARAALETLGRALRGAGHPSP
jgi:molecular chaperone DnaJ